MKLFNKFPPLTYYKNLSEFHLSIKFKNLLGPNCSWLESNIYNILPNFNYAMSHVKGLCVFQRGCIFSWPKSTIALRKNILIQLLNIFLLS